MNIPAEIWRFNNERIFKVFPFRKKVVEIIVDPLQETADTDIKNNIWVAPSRLKINCLRLYDPQIQPQLNLMQKQKSLK